MSVSEYNRIYNFSLAIIAIFNVVCLADVVLASMDLSGIISKVAVFYLIYAFGMLGYKVHLTRKYFLGNDVIYNLIAHGVLTATSIVFILITAF